MIRMVTYFMSEENIIKTIELDVEGNGEFVKVSPERLLKIHAAIAELLNLKTEKVVEKTTYIPYQQPIWYWNPDPLNIPYRPTITYANNDTVSPNISNLSVQYTADTNTAKLLV